MINEEKTFEDFGYISKDLKLHSDKLIWVTCEICGNERIIRMSTNVKTSGRCQSCGCINVKKLKRGPFNIEYFQSIKYNIINTNINELKTFEDFKYYSIDLTYGSHKKIWIICEKCNFIFIVSMKSYNHNNNIKLCKRCRSNGKMNGMYGKHHSVKSRLKMSATGQRISYNEWKSYATNSKYCIKFNNDIRENIRNKYDRRCFICGKLESENITSTGKYKRLSVHHVNMNKNQGCDEHEWKLIPVCIHCHGKLHNSRMQSYVEYILENEE